MRYLLYNVDRQVAAFEYELGTIVRFEEIEPMFLPKQLCGTTAEGFSLWLRNRTIDLKPVQHRQLAKILIGTQDKTAIAIRTHMFSVSDTFTCFTKENLMLRSQLVRTEDQDAVSEFIFHSCPEVISTFIIEFLPVVVNAFPVSGQSLITTKTLFP